MIRFLIGNLLHDTQYIEISSMGKMAGLRKHAEVMVRKILDIGSSRPLMLGQVKSNSNNSAVNSGMDNLGDELSDRLIETIRKISCYSLPPNEFYNTPCRSHSYARGDVSDRRF